MMTSQSLQVASPEDPFARLGIVANGILSVDIVLRVCIAKRRRTPVPIESFTDLLSSTSCSGESSFVICNDLAK
jgi:hypothetical protein